MFYMRVLPLLLLLVYPLYIRGDGSNGEDQSTEEGKSQASDMGNLLHSLQNINFMGNSLVNNLTGVFQQLARVDAGQRRDNANEELKTMVTQLTETVRNQGEVIQQQQQSIDILRKSLDKRLRENDLKIEWALTDGTLAPQNTSGIMKNLEKLEKKVDELMEFHGLGGKNDSLNQVPAFPVSCAEMERGVSGVHPIYPSHSPSSPVYVWCDKSAGGGWTVIQKRFDGSVDFFRTWEEYAAGFGDPSGEYWLGLRHIHTLTTVQMMELYVGITDFDRGFLYAKYASFSVSAESDEFRLNLGVYSGNAGDSLRRRHNGKQFSTKDRDNDPYSGHCSILRHGAWWYDDCTDSNLNGLFSKVKISNLKSMYWGNSGKAIKTSVMMIRPANFRP